EVHLTVRTLNTQKSFNELAACTDPLSFINSDIIGTRNRNGAVIHFISTQVLTCHKPFVKELFPSLLLGDIDIIFPLHSESCAGVNHAGGHSSDCQDPTHNNQNRNRRDATSYGDSIHHEHESARPGVDPTFVVV